MRDEIGAASRECRRVMPASAVPDQSHAGAVLPRDRFDPALDTLDGLIRTAGVDDETAHVGPIRSGTTTRPSPRASGRLRGTPASESPDVHRRARRHARRTPDRSTAGTAREPSVSRQKVDPTTGLAALPWPGQTHERVRTHHRVPGRVRCSYGVDVASGRLRLRLVLTVAERDRCRRPAGERYGELRRGDRVEEPARPPLAHRAAGQHHVEPRAGRRNVAGVRPGPRMSVGRCVLDVTSRPLRSPRRRATGARSRA